MNVRTIEIKRLMTPDAAKALWNEYPAKMAPTLAHVDDDCDATLFVDADDGHHVMALFPFPGDLAAYRIAVTGITFYNKIGRTSGIRTNSAAFGSLARAGHMKRNACSSCALAREQPIFHAMIADAAPLLWATLCDISTEARDATQAPFAEVLPEWRMGNSPYTSGVLNRTAALAYHLDRNNFDGAWSVMPSLRRFIRGGHLSVPEYGVVLPCNDGDVLGFPGSKVVHGVTPLAVDHAGGARHTIVYYPVRNMRNCLEPAAELARAQQTRTASEDTLMARHRANGLIT